MTNDYKDKTGEALVGCLGILAGPALQAWCVWLSAWSAHTIWQWYPIYGVKVLTVPEIFAVLTLIRLARGTSTTKEERYGIWEATIICSLLPLLLLASVAIFRWFTS